MAPHPGAYCGLGSHTTSFKADLGAIHRVQVGADNGEQRAPTLGRDQVPRGAHGPQGACNSQHITSPGRAVGGQGCPLTQGKGAHALTHSCSWGRWQILWGRGGTGRARGLGIPPRRSTELPRLRPGHQRREPCIGLSHCPAWRQPWLGGQWDCRGSPCPVLGTPLCQVEAGQGCTWAAQSGHTRSH